MSEFRVVNVVATADLKQKIDIGKVGGLIYGLHDEMYYGGRVAYLKARGMTGRVTVFPSGKLISVGTRSVEGALSDLTSAMNILVKAGLAEAVSLRLVVRNIVATTDLGQKIDLDRISREQDGISYEPEQFPGAICKFVEYPEISVLLFSSGKAVIAGARSIGTLEPIIARLSRLVRS